jgi:ribonuclease HI
MSIPAPHFLLFSDTNGRQQDGHWRFLLKSADGSAELEAADAEPETQGERLELLAVVRGLEALEQPSRVTLVTPSKYVHRGLLYGLEEWRTNGWSWEHFGQMVPVKNSDLWQRLDNALAYHDLEFRPWRFDQGAPGLSEPGNTADTAALTAGNRGERLAIERTVALGPAVPRQHNRFDAGRDNVRLTPQTETTSGAGQRRTGLWRRLGNWLRRLGGVEGRTAFAK